MSNEKLEAMVKAVNRAGMEANKWRIILRKHFSQFVGQKIEKVDGTLLKKVKESIPTLSCTPQLQIYRHTSNYSLAYVVKVCELIPSSYGCVYHEIVVYIGEMSNGVLVSLKEDPVPYRIYYTVEEIEEKRRKFKEAEKVYEEARSALYPFGEYDR